MSTYEMGKSHKFCIANGISEIRNKYGDLDIGVSSVSKNGVWFLNILIEIVNKKQK